MRLSRQQDEPRDENGNRLERYRERRPYDGWELIGIDNRGMAVYRGGENPYNGETLRVDALLEEQGMIDRAFRERPLYGVSPEEHVARTARLFGQWRYVTDPCWEKIRHIDVHPEQLGTATVRPTAHASAEWMRQPDTEGPVMTAWRRAEPFDWPGDDPAVTGARLDPESAYTFLQKGQHIHNVLPDLSTLWAENPELAGLVKAGVSDEVYTEAYPQAQVLTD